MKAVLFGLVVLFALPGCQKKISPELTSKLPEGTTVQKGISIGDFPCVECSEIERRIDRQLKSGPSLTIDPKSYNSWIECLSANEGVKVFLLNPGDYTSWGTLKVFEADGLVFSAAKPSLRHPVNQSSVAQVVLTNFILTDSRRILLNRLCFAGKDYHAKIGLPGGWQNKIDRGAENLVHRCVVRDVYRGSGIRIRNSNENAILHSVFEQSHPSLTGDHVAIHISANAGRESRGNKVLNNEIRNWNDGFMLGWSIPKKNKSKAVRAGQTGECPATLFAYNSIYLTPEFYQSAGHQAFAENAIDLKNGTSSNRPQDRIRIEKNKIWGFRQSVKKWSSGSSGAGIELHVNASNIDIIDNVILDVPVGIAIRSNSEKYQGAKTENILIKNNLFSQIKGRADVRDSGKGIILNTGKVEIKDNVFHEVDRLIDVRKKKEAVLVEENFTCSGQNKKQGVDCEISLSKWIKDGENVSKKKLRISFQP